jgi:hypothetical protein
MGRISPGPKVQIAIRSQVMHELKMNWFHIRLQKWIGPQSLLHSERSLKRAMVLGDVV